MLWFAALLLAPVPALQDAPQQKCSAMDANLPANLAAWTTPGGGDPADLTKPVTLTARAKENAPMVPPNAKEGKVTMIPVLIDTPGIYGVAIDQPAWIDVIPRGAPPLTSVKHGHGPQCSTIRKIVRFDLKPGWNYIFLTGIASPSVKVMLVAPE